MCADGTTTDSRFIDNDKRLRRRESFKRAFPFLAEDALNALLGEPLRKKDYASPENTKHV